MAQMQETFTFAQAKKDKVHVRAMFAGPTGSGKTYTALRVATRFAERLGSRVAVIDTEDAARLYAEDFDFDLVNLAPPYHPDRLLQAIDAAVAAGYEILVVDSLSHFWKGEGGFLTLVDQASARKGGNSYAAWAEVDPIFERFVEKLKRPGLHLFACARSKMAYELVENSRGKKAPQKIGLAPVQREGLEYEFDLFLEIDSKHTAIVSKTRCRALTDHVEEKAGEQFADVLFDWANEGRTIQEQYEDEIAQHDVTVEERLALARAHPKLPNDESEWNAGHYRTAFSALREYGRRLVERAVAPKAAAKEAPAEDWGEEAQKEAGVA